MKISLAFATHFAIATSVKFPSAAALKGRDSCSIRTDDVPCLHVPNCETGVGSFGNFKVSNDSEDVAASQDTSGTICYDATGIHVHEEATEEHIFSPYVQCNDEVFVNSDVLEVFIAPVLDVTYNPQVGVL